MAASENTVHMIRYPDRKIHGAANAFPRSARRRLMVAKVRTMGIAVGAIIATIMTDHMRNVIAKYFAVHLAEMSCMGQLGSIPYISRAIQTR